MKTTFRPLLVAALAVVAALSLYSCSDDPGAENYYTTKAEYATDFLRNRERYSEFLSIVERAGMTTLLSTYGSYTVFAPTNDAIDRYLASRGLTSVAELSREDCDTITFTHVIEQAYFTTDFNDGTYATLNMLERPLTITCDSDTLTSPGHVQLAVYINAKSRMVQMDDSVENGVVHTMSSVISASNSMLPDAISEDSTATLFYNALRLCHLDDSLAAYIDRSYTIGVDSIDWSNDALVEHTGNEYDNTSYMEHRYFKFTAFVPQDQTLAAKYGVTDIDGLQRLAHECYDPAYPDDAGVTDPADRRHALNRFISYHLLPFLGDYYKLTAVDGPNSKLANAMFNRRMQDISCWYETMLPGAIMKFSYPSGTETGLYVNRRGIMSRPDQYGVKIRGVRVIPASEAGRLQTAVNGCYHYIDDILSYGYHPGQGINTQTDVMSERIRVDCSALSPDFMTSGARGHYIRSTTDGGKYGQQSFSTSAASNPNTCLAFKPGTLKNYKFDAKTRIYLRPRYLPFASYEGDEVVVKGRYDLEAKLPPVPQGEWEVRYFTCVGLGSRGIVQFYLDGVPCGIPFDMRNDGPSSFIGWRNDNELGDEEQIASFDRAFRYRGWMKGPLAAGFSQDNGQSLTQPFRGWTGNLRKIIGTFRSDGITPHYIRIQQKMESENNECDFDMIELCPRNVYDNPERAEDRY